MWVMGAGSVGCWIGGCLQAAGVEVTFIGRPRVLDALRTHGLALTSLDGQRIELPAARLALADVPPASPAPALVLLTVKSAATREAAAQLGRALPARTLVLSLQNGIGNADAARVAAPALEVIAGMVAFNVAELGPGRLHRGTSGTLAAADHPALHAWLPTFAAAGLPLDLHADMRSVQWAKLLLNLNNPVNALSGLPLREQLLIRGYRRVLAALQDEALAVLDSARIAPARLTPLPARAVPWVLRLPTLLFRAAAFGMLRIDATARSSMADDVAHGRPTEIDALCGEVVRLAQGLGIEAPLNARITTLVRDLAVAPRRYDAASLLRALSPR
jgi:2-dehydropantoate 2-reductase